MKGCSGGSLRPPIGTPTSRTVPACAGTAHLRGTRIVGLLLRRQLTARRVVDRHGEVRGHRRLVARGERGRLLLGLDDVALLLLTLLENVLWPRGSKKPKHHRERTRTLPTRVDSAEGERSWPRARHLRLAIGITDLVDAFALGCLQLGVLLEQLRVRQRPRKRVHLRRQQRNPQPNRRNAWEVLSRRLCAAGSDTPTRRVRHAPAQNCGRCRPWRTCGTRRSPCRGRSGSAL
jgi:hypothetical protein